MNDFLDFIIYVALSIGLFLMLILPATLLVKFSNDWTQTQNCAALQRNGYDTHIEYLSLFGIPFLKDCYVKTEKGAVPYDRFRASEYAGENKKNKGIQVFMNGKELDVWNVTLIIKGDNQNVYLDSGIPPTILFGGSNITLSLKYIYDGQVINDTTTFNKLWSENNQ